LQNPHEAAVTLQSFLDRIAGRTLSIGIVGLGYVGLPLALLFSEDRFRITGLDIDPEKVAKLNKTESYIHRIEPGHLRAAQQSGFHATVDFSAIGELDAILICVPTPLHPDHTPDMSYVVATIEAIAPHLHPGQLVVLESTTYPGTTEEIIVATIERHGQRVLRTPQAELKPETPLDGVLVAFSPEREDPGNFTTPRREIPKVVGGVDAAATQAACALYGAASTKPFGFHAFYPGPGVGGHCIPVDPFYLSWKARQFGLETTFIELAGKTNEAMPAYIVETTQKALGGSLAGANILVLGVAYKKNVDDLRESPALTIIDLLQQAGAQVRYNDPFFPTVGTGRKYRLQMQSTPLDTLIQYDCVMILTDHSTYDYPSIVAEARLVIDTRNATRGIQSDKIVRC
jgi:UDP-N-acetyl-D-glucosamine dehydrogenase